uniref:Uncharacterized protein n=1 Tax=Anguilla anguilla TaxID=7936 RepID=A0A0E9WVL5_ANGAN
MIEHTARCRFSENKDITMGYTLQAASKDLHRFYGPCKLLMHA